MVNQWYKSYPIFQKARFYAGLRTQVSILPWQMKSTLIFINSLLVGYEIPRFAALCAIPFDKRNVRLSSGHSTVCTLYGKSRQNKAKCYTQTDSNRIRILGKSIRLKKGAIVRK